MAFNFAVSSKVYQVEEGDCCVQLNYDIARRLRLPELYGSDIMQKNAFTLFDAYPYVKDNPKIKYSDRYPWLKESTVITDYPNLLRVSIPTHRVLEGRNWGRTVLCPDGKGIFKIFQR